MCGWAAPTDKQVLELYQRWNTALAGASDFNGVTPLMSKASIQEVAKLDVKQQQAMFGMMKAMVMMGGAHTWSVEGHRREKGFLLYKLVHKEKNTSGSAEFPVAEEDGQLKVDFRKK